MSNYSIALLVSVLTTWLYTGTEAELKEHTYPLLVSPQSVVHIADTGKKQVVHRVDGVANDTSDVEKNPNKHPGDPTKNVYVSPMFLKNPKNLQYQFELKDDGSGFNIYEKVGTVSIRRPSQIPFEDYLEYRREHGMLEYFREKSLQANEGIPKGLIPNVDLGAVSDIFGGGAISIRPTGYATLDFSVDRNVQENPNLNQRDQRRTLFNFDQQIQLGVIGEIGEKLRLNANFDTQATFDFDNELKLKHEGTEDQILQSIEAGNVSMQLGNSLMQGRQNLFGIKSRLKFGPFYVTAIGSTERGKVESVRVGGNGAVETPFEKEVSQYDVDRHYFLSHYFRSRYEAALENLPIINSPIRINRVQVWVERGGTTRDTRNGVGFTDLGENSNSLPGPPGFLPQGGKLFNTQLLQNQGNSPFPDNQANDLFSILQGNSSFREMKSAAGALEGAGFENTLDFEVAGNMRKLEPTEYTLHPQLGYISLNSRIPNDQVLFVAYNYTLNGQTFQVGEFSDDIPSDGLNSNVLFLKMLKSTVLRPTYQDPVTLETDRFPLWDLMMKNIYNIGYGIKETNFFLDVQYESGTSAGKINYFPDGNLKNKPLLQVLKIDQLTNHTAPGPDFRFDFVEGLTMISDKGLVIFPVLEPFGEFLARSLNDPNDSANYVFQALYEDTPVGAVQNFPHLDRYTLEGYYQSSTGGGASEIPLNAFDLEEGSVTLTQGGRPLREGVDYRVDYFGGKVIILNEAILTSGQEIEVNYESQSLYSIQTKTLLGTRVEYAASQDLSLGATILNLREQPFNQKTTLGEEPINNTLWGFDGAVNRPSDFLTRMVDKLPLISTKETSQITAAGEFAQFLPGQPKIVKTAEDLGIVFLDDFESAKNVYPLQTPQRWRLASLPHDDAHPARMAVNMLPNAADPLAEGFTRAKLAWYQIDQGFYQNLIAAPPEDLANNYTRRIDPNEIFPTARRAFGTNFQFTLDLNYDPSQRGPYNLQYNGTRLAQDGTFSRPEENWAGIMREIDITNDFEAFNVEFLEFWLMDPFLENPNHEGGDMYLNLGLISEDILPDKALSLENGLPKDGTNLNLVNETPWGRIPIGNPPTDNFERDEEGRANQDIGLDGLNDENERSFFQTYLNQLAGVVNGGALAQVEADPSTDNFQHFRDDEFEDQESPILTRYSNFNGLEGNTPFGNDNKNFSIQGNQNPDTEDLNRNGSLNSAEQYWEYKIRIRPQDLVVGRNFIVDRIDRDNYELGNGQTVDVTWYQFRIPIAGGTPINGINNFKSINFMRMMLNGWKESTIMRMTEFQFVATQWRRYLNDLSENSQVIAPPEPPFPEFEVGSLSLEENSTKSPFAYVLAPGVRQQSINGNTAQGFLQNERSLQMKLCNLTDGDARAIFKNDRKDYRQYDSLRMWVHAEPLLGGSVPANFNQMGDVEVFMRLGLDNDFNYYEYILPVSPSAPGSNARENVWSNEFNFKLADLSAAKRARDNDPTGVISERFLFLKNGTLPPGHKIVVKGTPKLSDIRNIMIGVRNPKTPSNPDPVCVEIWVNELRLTDFDKTSGWAANANLNLKLADVAQINANFAHRTAGFGPLEQRVTDRTQSETTRYDVAVNFNLDKLTPKKWGLQMPVYATYGEQVSSPVYDPREADVRTDVLLSSITDENEKKEELAKIQDIRKNRSISLNNWKKIRNNPEKKAHFWDVENFDFTFAYNEENASSSVIEKRFATTHRAAINYRYNFKPLNWQPFKEAKPNNPLGLINFSPVPTSITVSVLGDRRFEERKLRPAKNFGGEIPSSFTKNFLITRNYNLVWNLTQNLQMNFNAINNARVDEVRGYWADATQRERDSVGTLLENLLTFGRSRREVGGFTRLHDNLVNFGRNTNYMHNLNLTYQLPFSKFPLLNWINGNVNYAGTFQWQQAPEINPGLGGIISNSQAIQANARIDLKGLYGKWKFLKKIQDDYAKRGREAAAGRNNSQNTAPDPPRPQAGQDTTRNKPDPFWFLKKVGNEILRIAMSVQSVDLNVSTNGNTVLPGYTPQTDNFGLDFRFRDIFGNESGILPPTLGFILGGQQDIRGKAASNGWITQDTTLSNVYMQNLSLNFTGRTSIELFRGFRIELNATRNEVKNGSSFFRYDPNFIDPTNPFINGYRAIDPLSQGNFTMSYIFINTAFEKFRPEFSETFEAFSRNRQIVSTRLATENPNGGVLSRQGIVEGGYQNGFLGNNQDVLLPALLGSYGLIKIDKVSLKNFPTIPLPNWSINYNGLSNIPFLKQFFNSVTLKHTYRATYTIGNFINNLNAEFDIRNGFVNNFAYYALPSGDSLENFYSVNSIANVAIREDFSPFLGLSMNMKNGMTASLDYKRSRMLNFSVGTLQLSELRNQDLAVMVGYRKEKVNLQFNAFGKHFDLQNSMNFQFRLTMRDTRELNRNLGFDSSNADPTLEPQYTRGTLNWIISPSIDYVVNTRLNIKFFYEQNINRPWTSQSYNTNFASGGIQLRFTLSK